MRNGEGDEDYDDNDTEQKGLLKSYQYVVKRLIYYQPRIINSKENQRSVKILEIFSLINDLLVILKKRQQDNMQVNYLQHLLCQQIICDCDEYLFKKYVLSSSMQIN